MKMNMKMKRVHGGMQFDGANLGEVKAMLGFTEIAWVAKKECGTPVLRAHPTSGINCTVDEWLIEPSNWIIVREDGVSRVYSDEEFRYLFKQT